MIAGHRLNGLPAASPKTGGGVPIGGHLKASVPPFAGRQEAPCLGLAPHDAVNRLQEELGLSARDLATALDVDRRTLERWLSGDTYPRREARRRLAMLLKLDERLGDTFTGRDAVRSWLNGPNRYLGGMRPIEALRAGRFDRVDAALEVIDSGIFV